MIENPQKIIGKIFGIDFLSANESSNMKNANRWDFLRNTIANTGITRFYFEKIVGQAMQRPLYVLGPQIEGKKHFSRYSWVSGRETGRES
jgi:hypothetical protein